MDTTRWLKNEIRRTDRCALALEVTLGVLLVGISGVVLMALVLLLKCLALELVK